MEGAKCFLCGPNEEQRQAIQTYLLAVMAGGSTDPFVLLSDAKCFLCLSREQQVAVQSYLLCQVANGNAAVTCMYREGNGTPIGVLVPDFIGQLYLDHLNGLAYMSTTLNNTGWFLISSGLVWGPNQATAGNFVTPGLTDVGTTYFFPAVTSFTGNFTCYSESGVTSITLPLLLTCIGTLTAAGNISMDLFAAPAMTNCGLLDLSDNQMLVNVMLNALNTVTGMVDFHQDYSLVTLALPALVTVTGNFTAKDCIALQNFSAPNWVPNNGTVLDFRNCNLQPPSIAAIMAIARAAGNFGVPHIDVKIEGGSNASPDMSSGSDYDWVVNIYGYTVTHN